MSRGNQTHFQLLSKRIDNSVIAQGTNIKCNTQEEEKVQTQQLKQHQLISGNKSRTLLKLHHATGPSEIIVVLCMYHVINYMHKK